MHILPQIEQISERSKIRELLIQCSDLSADLKIRDAAIRNLDERMLAIVSRELVASEGHYHRSCYRSYTRV